MAHERKRYLADIISKELSWSPSIGILGMRQAGKTTLLKQFSKGFFSFDSIETISQFDKASAETLTMGPFPMGLDEVQKFPPIFDALKVQIDRHKIPGRYLLTGSVRFSSRKSIRESLTGRISILELLPFTIAESHGRPLSRILTIISKMDSERALEELSKGVWTKDADIIHYLGFGGLPGICFKRDAEVRDKLFKNHLETILGRDIQFLYETSLSLGALVDLYSFLCQSQGEPVRVSQLARQVGSTAPTITKVIEAMEGLFLLRRHGKLWFAEDVGLASFANRFKTEPPLQQISRFVFSEIKAQVQYLFSPNARFTQYIRRGGIEIPFLVEFKNRSQIAIAVEAGDKISDKASKGMTWYRKKFPNAKAIIFHRGKTAYLSSSNIFCLPWTWCC